MASSKLMRMSSPNSKSTNPHSLSHIMTVDALLRTVYTSDPPSESVEDVWREIVSGDVKEEMITLEDFLARAGEEDAVKVPPAERLSGGVFALDLIPPSSFQAANKVEGSVIGFRNGRGKRARPVLEPLDKAAQQRQRRMIKNRESAARSEAGVPS